MAITRHPKQSRSIPFDGDRSGILLVSRGQTLKSIGGDRSTNATAMHRILMLWSIVPSLMAVFRRRVKRAGEIPKEIDYRTLALMKMRISMTKITYRWRNCFGEDNIKIAEKAKSKRYQPTRVYNRLQ